MKKVPTKWLAFLLWFLVNLAFWPVLIFAGLVDPRDGILGFIFCVGVALLYTAGEDTPKGGGM